jgi:hypothetical protein
MKKFAIINEFIFWITYIFRFTCERLSVVYSFIFLWDVSSGNKITYFIEKCGSMSGPSFPLPKNLRLVHKTRIFLPNFFYLLLISPYRSFHALDVCKKGRFSPIQNLSKSGKNQKKSLRISFFYAKKTVIFPFLCSVMRLFDIFPFLTKPF